MIRAERISLKISNIGMDLRSMVLRESLFLIRTRRWHRFSVIIFFLQDVRSAVVKVIVEPVMLL